MDLRIVYSTKTLSPMRLIQITDCHLGSHPGESLLGLDTDESFADVLHRLSRDEKHADFVVASGDVASEGSIEAYERFLGALKAQYDLPVAWLSGNHDLDELMQQFSKEQVQREHIEFEHWQLILLNSSIPHEERGELAETELERLRHCLETCDKHALVFVHHQPVPVGCDWLDQYVISNSAQLLEILNEYPQVKGLVWGHVHQEFQARHQHFNLYSTPSTCIQFKPNSDDFALDDTMPGYRWFNLHQDGRLETGVERVEEKAYGIDFASAGY